MQTVRASLHYVIQGNWWSACVSYIHTQCRIYILIVVIHPGPWEWPDVSSLHSHTGSYRTANSLSLQKQCTYNVLKQKTWDVTTCLHFTQQPVLVMANTTSTTAQTSRYSTKLTVSTQLPTSLHRTWVTFHVATSEEEHHDDKKSTQHSAP